MENLGWYSCCSFVFQEGEKKTRCFCMKDKFDNFACLVNGVTSVLRIAGECVSQISFASLLVNVQYHILTQIKRGSEKKFCLVFREKLRLEKK